MPSLSTLILSNWTRILIWSIFFIFFAVLTIRDLLPLLSRYRYENTATQIRVVKNEPIPRPDVSVCLPYSSGSLATITNWINLKNDTRGNHSRRACLECEGLRNQSWDVWNFTENSNRVNETELASALIERILENPNFEELLNVSQRNFNWNQPLVDAIWRFFACAGTQDIQMAMRYLSGSTEQFCQGLNVSKFELMPKKEIDRLYDSMLEAVDVYFDILSVIPKNQDEEDQKIKTKLKFGLKDRQEGMTIMGAHFCMVMKNTTDEQYTFTPFPDHFNFTPPWIRSPKSQNFIIFEDDSSLYANSGANFEPLYTSRNDQGATNGFQEYIILTYKIDYTVTESRSDVCRKIDSSLVTCLAQIFQEYAVEECACIPFTYRFLGDTPQDLPYCTGTHYKKCRNGWNENYQNHKINCTNKCDYIFYEWQFYKHSPSSKKDPIMISLRVRLEGMSEPFVQFSITIKDSFEQFLAQIGGVANLYLGYSGMSIGALVIICVDWMMENYRAKKLEQKEEDIKKEVDQKYGKQFYQEEIFKYVDEKIEAVMKKVDESLHKLEEKVMREDRSRF